MTRRPFRAPRIDLPNRFPPTPIVPNIDLGECLQELEDAMKEGYSSYSRVIHKFRSKHVESISEVEVAESSSEESRN